ncbi:TPA: hypothetical protein QC295_002358 [Bacillus cereus]|nr:hypothetical protein [Bacillus cereus]
MNDVYAGFKWNPYDAKIGKEIIKREGTPEAIKYFAEVCEDLTDYGYWFFLSTLWVSYSGHSDLNLWKKLFSSKRPKRKKSIMKPSELKDFDYLPYFVTVYRAHRVDESDWIAYTLDQEIAERFAREREVTKITEYKVKKSDILAYFSRRGEKEIIVLDKAKVQFVAEIDLLPIVEQPIEKDSSIKQVRAKRNFDGFDPSTGLSIDVKKGDLGELLRINKDKIATVIIQGRTLFMKKKYYRYYFEEVKQDAEN